MSTKTISIKYASEWNDVFKLILKEYPDEAKTLEDVSGLSDVVLKLLKEYKELKQFDDKGYLDLTKSHLETALKLPLLENFLFDNFPEQFPSKWEDAREPIDMATHLLKKYMKVKEENKELKEKASVMVKQFVKDTIKNNAPPAGEGR